MKMKWEQGGEPEHGGDNVIHFKLEFDIEVNMNASQDVTYKIIGNIVDELREKLQRMDDVEAITTLTFDK